MRKILLALAVPCFSTPAVALNHSPLVYNECLNRHIETDFRAAGARRWEQHAIRAISRDGLSKDITDLVPTDCGAFGVFHLQPDKYPLNIEWKGECAYEDTEWAHHILSLLYSDHSAALQLLLWRGSIDVAIWPARRAGLRGRELAVVAAIANTSPSLSRRLGLQHEWDVHSMLEGYIDDRPSGHRRRRANFIIERLL